MAKWYRLLLFVIVSKTSFNYEICRHCVHFIDFDTLLIVTERIVCVQNRCFNLYKAWFSSIVERESIYLNSSSVNIFIFEGKIEIRTFKSRCLKINSRLWTTSANCYLLSIFLWLANERTNNRRRKKKKASVICCFCARHANSLGTCTSMCIYAAVQFRWIQRHNVTRNIWGKWSVKRYFSGVGNIFVWTMTQFIPIAHLSLSTSF